MRPPARQRTWQQSQQRLRLLAPSPVATAPSRTGGSACCCGSSTGCSSTGPGCCAEAVYHQLPNDAGLQMMETRSNGAAAVAVVEELVKRGRARPPRAEVAAEPMQMVETGNQSRPQSPRRIATLQQALIGPLLW